MRRLRQRLKTAGIGHGVLHTFRHTGATRYANDPTVPIIHVQRFLGHRKINTTMRYVHPNANEISASITGAGFGTNMVGTDKSTEEKTGK
jgi:integrase